MAILWAVCPIALSKGAFEPWASDTDPTDVPKSHVQEITTAAFIYNITQGGTMDGKMCRTLPGVWKPYEQTWESNRSVRLENVGTRNVINPWLKIGPIDFFSQQTMASSVTEGLSTDREKALAIFYFYITHRYHKGNGDNGAQGDVSQAINVFGFNTLGGDMATMMLMRDNYTFTYLEHTDNRSGVNAARHLKITHNHNWVERSKTRLPQAPESPVYRIRWTGVDGHRDMPITVTE
jgi:hypothetical protein